MIASATGYGSPRAAWLLGVTVREYRELEAGDRTPGVDTWERMVALYGWPV